MAFKDLGGGIQPPPGEGWLWFRVFTLLLTAVLLGGAVTVVGTRWLDSKNLVEFERIDTGWKEYNSARLQDCVLVAASVKSNIGAGNYSAVLAMNAFYECTEEHDKVIKVIEEEYEEESDVAPDSESGGSD